jgi:threonine dehydratase
MKPLSGLSEHPLSGIVRPVTVIQAPRLSERLEVPVVLLSETFQFTGSFKFRAAYRVASSVPNRTLLTASSGNFGQALAHACRLLGKTCTVIMPQTSARVKIDAVREEGATVDLIDVSRISRQARVRELMGQMPEAYFASAYDDDWVIAGNATLGMEIADLDLPVDLVVAPVGGGGLTAGILTGLRERGNNLPVTGAEPLIGNDAARSLRGGCLVANETEPATLADGARTVSLGLRNWEVLRDGLTGIVEVPEARIVEAIRLLFLMANLKVEPTGALAVAAVLTDPERFRTRRVGCVISGGNVDPGAFCSWIG